MEKSSATAVAASLETPTGLRFPFPHPSSASVLDEYYGFMYISDILQQWSATNQHPALETLLTEATIPHLLWEAERANHELIRFLNRETVVDRILYYAFCDPSTLQPSPECSIPLEDIKEFCKDLLSLEVNQGGVFDDAGQTRIIHKLFTSFFTIVEDDEQLRFQAPPHETGTLLQVMAYRPQSREKVLSYLADTPPDVFVDFFLKHLEKEPVADVLLTLMSLLSEVPPPAWVPTGGPRVMQISVSEFDVSLNLVLSFNEWLITGGLVDRTIAIITQHDEGLTERKQSEIAQKAFGLLTQVLVIARSHLSHLLLPPPIYYKITEAETIKPFLCSILLHKNDKVIYEGLEFLSSLMICDRLREGEKRRRLKENPSTEPTENETSSLRTGERDESYLLESQFNKILFEVLQHSMPTLLQRLRRQKNGLDSIVLGEGKAKQFQSDTMAEKTPTPSRETSIQKEGSANCHGTGPRRELFGLLRLKISGFLRALVFHFPTHYVDEELAMEFFQLLGSWNLLDVLIDLLVENPRVDILHSVIIQTLKPLFKERKARPFLKTVRCPPGTFEIACALTNEQTIREGSFVQKLMKILLLCRESAAQATLSALRTPLKEIVKSLTQAARSDPDLTGLLQEHQWWEQEMVVQLAQSKKTQRRTK